MSRSRRVLLIDDAPDRQAWLLSVLSRAGYTVTVVESAFGTVGLARRLAPCAILMGLDLPYGLGAALGSRLKSDPQTARIPLLILPDGSGVPVPPRLASMADAVLMAPLDEEALLDLVVTTHGSCVTHRRVSGGLDAGKPPGRSSTGSRPASNG